MNPSKFYTHPKIYIDKWITKDTIEQDLMKISYPEANSLVKYVQFWNENTKHINANPELAEIYQKIIKISSNILLKLKQQFDKEQKQISKEKLKILKNQIQKRDWIEFEKLLKLHDWVYEYSDVTKEYQNGKKERDSINHIFNRLKQVNEKRAIQLYNKYKK
jgi:hypothetical protein